MDEPVQVFLNYGRGDRLLIADLWRKLSVEGFTPWVQDFDLPLGKDWRFAINKAIQESDFFLACLSRRSMGSMYFRAELRLALELWREIPESDIYLIPVRLEPCEVPASLRRFMWVDLFEATGWPRLLSALRSELQRRREHSSESVLQADSLQGIANVTEKLQGVLDIPKEQTAAWRTAVRRFDRASSNVGQYLTLSSAYRKGEALNTAIEEMVALKSTLGDAPGWLVPRLRRIADRWLILLTKERQRFQERAAAMPETPNPFIFGTPVAEVDHNLFSGRQDVVRQIEESLLGARQSPVLLLQGSRRMGKSSILNQLPRLLGQHFAPAIVDCQNPAVTSSAKTMLRYLSRKISESLQRWSVIVEPLDEAALEPEPFPVFDEWLDKLEQKMPAGMRVLLCLDEYEQLNDTVEKGWGSSMLDFLRHIIQHRRHVVLMFTGAHTFAELGPIWTGRFINARRIRVSFLKRADVLSLLTTPIPEFDVTYEPDAFEAIVQATHGQPFLTQAVAFELVEFLNEQHRKRVTASDVEEAMQRALISGDSYFANVWSDAGEQGQEIMRAVAAAQSPCIFKG